MLRKLDLVNGGSALSITERNTKEVGSFIWTLLFANSVKPIDNIPIPQCYVSYRESRQLMVVEAEQIVFNEPVVIQLIKWRMTYNNDNNKPSYQQSTNSLPLESGLPEVNSYKRLSFMYRLESRFDFC